MKSKKYGIASLHKQFPNDDACLEFIFDVGHARECTRRLGRDLWTACGGRYKKVAGRRQFQCSKCRSQIAPTAGTIFNKSGTPLVLWFHAILAFFNAKGEISAKQLERDLEVTYKCAWRILSIIRGVLDGFHRPNARNLTYSEVLVMAIKAERPTELRQRKKKSGRQKRNLA